MTKQEFIDKYMNTKFSEWPKDLLEWTQEKTREIGYSGGVISDLLEIWYDEHK